MVGVLRADRPAPPNRSSICYILAVTNVEQHAELMARENLDDLAADDALLLIGELVDISQELGSVDGLNKAVALASELQRRPLDPEHSGRLHYFLGNAWFNLHHLVNQTSEWETPELERAILNLRTVLSKEEWLRALPRKRVCQIDTNIANILSDTGRVVEAIELWEDALRLVPGYGMTIGSHGYGLFRYAFVVPDPGHARFVMSFARACLTKAAALPLEHVDARDFFIARLTEAKRILGSMVMPDSDKLNSSSLGRSERERQYRKWCLEHRLFLNPLNDLGKYSIGATDRMTLPSMVRPINEGPTFQGLFNQLKQEFTSARFFYYDGLQVVRGHFADRGVYQLNTLDYPSYSLNVERVKVAFRIAYSIFDKVAFFLNEYFKLGMPPGDVSFRRIWYTKGDKKKGLRPDVQAMSNWPLKALYWVSKDLSENRPEFAEAMQPDSKLLASIRNHLEHRYLKLHEEEWVSVPRDPQYSMDDTLALSLGRSSFEKKVLRILKLVRASLIYLVCAVKIEESYRGAKAGLTPVGQIDMDAWRDDWKV